MYKMMKRLAQLGVPLGCLMHVGCLSLQLGTDSNPPQLNARGLVNGHFTATGFEPYDGKIMKAGIFGDADRPGELASLDVWPIGGLGVGFVGGRIRILPVEMGFGILGYDPKPIIHEDVDTQDEAATSE